MKNFLNNLINKDFGRSNFCTKFEHFTKLLPKIICFNLTNIKNTSNKLAFTLAEVLITITIVGVVVAMTLPNLQQSYNKHFTEVRLKKFYADFNNAIRMAESDYGPHQYWSDYWALSNGANQVGAVTPEKFDKVVKKYFAPFIKISAGKHIGNYYVFECADGSAFGYAYNSNNVGHIREILFFPNEL